MEVYHYGEGRPRSLSYALLDDAARYEEFPALSQPALIFHGAHDDVAPPEYSRQFAAHHPNARLEILDARHDLLNVLDTIAPPAIEFLTGTSR
jgi:pimeloyl-ACP methyl ester carboxylesterase